MKRAELLVKFDGVENKSDLVDFILNENGKDIENAKKSVKSLETERDEAKAKVKEYEKGGERYIDTTELEELRKFKTDTTEAKTKDVKTKAVNDLLKENKASDKAINLLAKTFDLSKIEIGEDGKIKDAEKLVEPLKTDYADFFTVTEQGGAKAGTPVPTPIVKADTLASAVAEKLGQ